MEDKKQSLLTMFRDLDIKRASYLLREEEIVINDLFDVGLKTFMGFTNESKYVYGSSNPNMRSFQNGIARKTIEKQNEIYRKRIVTDTDEYKNALNAVKILYSKYMNELADACDRTIQHALVLMEDETIYWTTPDLGK